VLGDAFKTRGGTRGDAVLHANPHPEPHPAGLRANTHNKHPIAHRDVHAYPHYHPNAYAYLHAHSTAATDRHTATTDGTATTTTAATATASADRTATASADGATASATNGAAADRATASATNGTACAAHTNPLVCGRVRSESRAMKSRGTLQLLAASLIGLACVVGLLLVLARETSASPLPQQPRCSISSDEDADPDLAVTKSDSADPAVAGGALSYTLVITNNGPATATGVAVTDTLPAGVTFVTATVSQGSCNQSGSVVTCTIGSLTISSTTNVTITVAINPSTRNILTNTAEIAGNETDGELANNIYTETTTINAEADLSLVKTDSPDPATVGESITYTLIVTNNGPSDATAVILTDTLPTDTDFVTATLDQGDCTAASSAITCTVDVLTSSFTITGTVVVTVADYLPNGIVLTNSTGVDSLESAPRSAEVTTTVHAPVLELTKRDYFDPIPTRALLTYTLNYTNTGQAPAPNVVIADVLDNRTIYVSASPTPTNWTTPTLYWNIGPLAPPLPGKIVISVTVQHGLDEGTVLTNSASIDSQQTEPSLVTETTAVISHSTAASVALAPATATISAGDVISYILAACDAYGNDWDVTASGSYTIAPAAGGVWAANIYTAEKHSTWPVTATYTTLTDTAILTVVNVAPTAVISSSDTTDEGQSLSLDGSLSYDPGNDIISYAWDLDDDALFDDAFSATTPYTWNEPGTFTVSLIVSDVQGLTHTAATTVTVNNLPPSADAGGPYSGDEAMAIQLIGSGSDPGGSFLAYAWDLNDDGLFDDAFSTTTPYTWNEPGLFTVSLVISDVQGLTHTAATTVTVNNLPPSADAGGPYTGTAGTPITLTAWGSSDPGGGVLTCTWDLDDDGEHDDASGAVVTYTWYVAGTHTATVKVADIQAAMDEDSALVSIDPAELATIVVSPPTSSILAGETQTYTAEAFDVYANSRGDVTTQTTFSILESGHGGHWTGNVYASIRHGDWEVRSTYTETIVATDTVTLTVLAPVLHIEKSADPNPVEAGAALTYTLIYSNTGNQAATGIVVTDTLDPNVNYAGANPVPDGGTPNAPFWLISSLDPNEVKQIVITTTVTSPLTNNTTLANVAWLDADRLEPDQTKPLSATQQTTVHSRPVLTITKIDSRDPADAGGFLGYTLVISNSGNENATVITVTEQYDPNVSFLFSNPDPDPGSENKVWTFPLAASDCKTINIGVQVKSPLSVGTVLTNQATVSSTRTSPITVTETTSVTTVSELTISKDDFDDPVDAGGDLIYVISYQNPVSATAPAEDVVITETYDSHVSYVSAIPIAPKAGTDNVWEIGDLDVGNFGFVQVTVHVDTPLSNGTILTNLVTIDSLYTSPKTYTETTTVSSAPDLASSLTGYPEPVEAGDPLTYTLRYTNTGNADTTGVVVTATLDSHVSLSNATPPPDEGSGQVRVWNVGTISGEGGQAEIIVYAAVTLPLTNGITLDFVAQLADAEGDFLENAVTTTVSSAPVISFDKTDDVSTVYAGDLLTYTLTCANSGNENVYDAIITDTLPNYVAYMGYEIEDGTCDLLPPAQPDVVVFHIPVITAQTSSQAQIFVQVDDPLSAGATSITNHARLAAPSLAAPIDVQDVDSIGTLPDLKVTATHEPILFAPGKLMSYTIAYTNAERMDAAGVVITTTLPSNTTYASHGWSTSDGQTYAHDVGGLPAGTSREVQFAVQYPDQPQIDAEEFSTPFTISGAGTADANPGDNSANVTIGVPDLVVTDLTVEPLPLQPNTPVTFTIVLVNQGTGTAQNSGGGGFWVDVFIKPIASYPFERYSEKFIYDGVPALAPGAAYTLVITRTGPLEPTRERIHFNEQEVWHEIEAFYVKVDNDLQNPYGLVPEHSEMNNLGEPVNPQSGASFVYLPLVVRSQ
jgi:uncharacterized repeat protein (TIGR01451 family)